jgi:hypothetical protein
VTATLCAVLPMSYSKIDTTTNKKAHSLKLKGIQVWCNSNFVMLVVILRLLFRNEVEVVMCIMCTRNYMSLARYLVSLNVSVSCFINFYAAQHRRFNNNKLGNLGKRRAFTSDSQIEEQFSLEQIPFLVIQWSSQLNSDNFTEETLVRLVFQALYKSVV